MRQAGHLPTYIAIPLATGAFFFTAIFGPLVQLLNTAPAAAVMVGVVWIALYILMHYGDELEHFVSLAAAFLTMIIAGILAEAYAADPPMTKEQFRLLIVGTVMSVLAAVNMGMVWRRRRREAEYRRVEGEP